LPAAPQIGPGTAARPPHDGEPPRNVVGRSPPWSGDLARKRWAMVRRRTMLSAGRRIISSRTAEGRALSTRPSEKRSRTGKGGILNSTDSVTRLSDVYSRGSTLVSKANSRGSAFANRWPDCGHSFVMLPTALLRHAKELGLERTDLLIIAAFES